MDDPLDTLRPGLFAEHTLFVTGGGSGINLGIAEVFARLGAAIGLCGRDAERLDRARERLLSAGARAVSSAPADVRDADALAAAMQQGRDEFGPMHTLVCGAAGNFPALAKDLSPNGFRAVVDIDLNGSFNASRAAFDQLRETRGSILMISAHQAIAPYAAQAHVGAAKAGVEQLVRQLALEWGQYGIRVNAIAPGPVEDTEGVRRLLPGENAHKAARLVPLGRLGRTTDIGAAAAFLSSPLANHVTGAILPVDGGGGLAGSGPWNALVAASLQ